MRRVAGPLALVLAVACRGGSPAGHAVREPVVAVSPPSPREPEPPPAPPPLAAPIEAPPSGVIVELTATRAADAVLTVDSSEGVRLWPTLDGTREPLVVELPAARSLALARTDSGFFVGLRDDAGGLVIARLDADGRVLVRATIAPDPAVTGIVGLDAGVLAWRADHTMVLYGGDAQVRAELAAEPGQRVVTIGATAEGAVAVLQVTGADDTTRPRARAIVATDHHLAWGAWLDPGPEIDGRLALSPSGHYLARLVPAGAAQGVHLEVIDLANGHVVATHLADARRAIGFMDDAHALVEGRGAMQLVPVDGSDPVAVVAFKRARGPAGGVDAFAAGNGAAITASEKQLVIVRGGDVHYLGYGASAALPAQADGHGGLMVSTPADDGLELLHIDRELKAREVVDVGNLERVVSLGNDRWVIHQVGPKSPPETLAIVDATTSAVIVVGVPPPPYVVAIRAEPTTGLVGIASASASLLRYDPQAQTLTAVPVPAGTGRADAVVDLVPVAPALAGGMRLVRVTSQAPLIVEWLRDETAAATMSLEIMGKLAGADRAGHVFVWQPDWLIVLDHGATLASIPDPWQRGLWPEPSGARFVMRTPNGIATYTVDGRLRWELTLPEVDDVEWLDGDKLAIIASGSIARVSASTGKIDELRCGWEFQLSATPLATMNASETLCTRPL